MSSAHQRSLVAIFIACSLFAIGGCGSSGDTYDSQREANPGVVVPAWAPQYADPQYARYYYLPDAEVYYDVWNRDFVYLQDGQWLFSSDLPPQYAGFDLYDSYVVVLDDQVYQPWMHHHYYVAHYPRYYYYSTYNVSDRRQVRGFNENTDHEIRLTAAERERLDNASRSRPQSDRAQAPARRDRPSASSRPPQRMKYDSPEVGKRVPVQKQMRRPRRQDDQQQRKGEEGKKK